MPNGFYPALLFLSVLAYINVLLLSNPRVMYAMSEDKILPAAFQQRNKRGALTLALSVFAVIGRVDRILGQRV